jgi:hypothetical protein
MQKYAKECCIRLRARFAVDTQASEVKANDIVDFVIDVIGWMPQFFRMVNPATLVHHAR